MNLSPFFPKPGQSATQTTSPIQRLSIALQSSLKSARVDCILSTDKPVAGLLPDLERCGLLEDALVWWGVKFGRTPFAQGKNGRNRNPRAETTVLLTSMVMSYMTFFYDLG